MTNRKEHIKQIKSEIKKRQEEILESLAVGNTEKAKKDLEWIALSKQIILEQQKRKNIIQAVIIGIICLLSIGIISVSHVKSTLVTFLFNSETLTIKLAEEWQNKNTMELHRVYIGNIVKVSSSLNPDIYSSVLPAVMEFMGENIAVKTINLNKQAEIDLRNNGNTISLFVKDSVINGKIGLRKGIFQLNELTDSIDIPVNLPMLFYTFTSLKQPHLDDIRLDFSPADKFTMENIKIGKLNFLTENPSGSGNFESSFLNGQIILHDVKNEIELLNGENIRVEFTKCREAKIFVKDGKTEINITGEVKTLKGGLNGESKNYKPTLLEYYYQNQRIGLLWSAFVFLIGILYSVKNTFLKSSC